MILRIFSCACWPFVCLLWRNVYLDLLPIFWLHFILFFIELCTLLVWQLIWKLTPDWLQNGNKNFNTLYCYYRAMSKSLNFRVWICLTQNSTLFFSLCLISSHMWLQALNHKDTWLLYPKGIILLLFSHLGNTCPQGTDS